MATLEEVSGRLMNSAKDLADWNFPFSAVLEEYRTLQETQRDANLNKAALVLQNSANAYVRRVEYLFQDTTLLIQTFVDEETANESKKNTKKDGSKKKTVIDLIDFEPVDFSQYIAKNNNIKNRGIQNSIKLLGQRFPQLENASRSAKPDQDNSTGANPEQDNDHDVGKRYAFRCNQYITSSGMLVEQLVPEDVLNNSSLEASTDTSIETLDSGVDSSGCDNHTEFTETTNTGTSADSQRCVGSTPTLDPETDLMNTSFCSAVDSGRGSSLRTTTRPDSSLSNDRECNWEESVAPRPCSSLSTSDANSLVSPMDITDLENDDTPDSSPSKRGVDECENSTNRSDRTESTTLTVEQCRRSKRIRSLFDVVRTSDSSPLEPIPFENVQDELSKSRKEFKLPCPISLLKCSERSKKRQINSEARKRRLQKMFIDTEVRSKKMTMYSPTRQIFFPLMEEQLQVVPKYFNKYLRSLRDFETLQQYEAVTNESMNLLGYKNNYDKTDSLEYESANTSEDATTTEIPDSVDDFPMPDTPESFNSPERMSPPPFTCSSRIERLVHDIYESADVRTEQEEAVIRWHEEIQLKLKEAKSRPKFQMAEYTSRVIKSLKDNRGRITFETLVRQNKPPEAARYLLASLMLANKYNLRIDASDSKDNVMLLLLKE